MHQYLRWTKQCKLFAVVWQRLQDLTSYRKMQEVTSRWTEEHEFDFPVVSVLETAKCWVAWGGEQL